MSDKRTLSIALRAGLIVGFFVLFALHRDFVMDDAFIAYRYSQNLAQGHGLVWNAGEDPVEGYTSFFWVLLHALGIRVGLDPVFLSKTLGLTCSLAVLVLLTRACRHLHPAQVAVFVGAIALSPTYAFLTTQGLETPLAALLLLAASSVALELVRRPSASTATIWHTVAFFAALTRPDSLPFLAGLFLGIVAMFFLQRDDSRTPSHSTGLGDLGRIVVAGLPFVALGVLYMVWRIRYFGHLFPNPYYIKTGDGAQPIGPDALGGPAYVAAFGVQVLLPYVLVTVSLWRRGLDKRSVVQTLPILLGCTLFALYLLTITPIQGYFWRFVAPAYPALLFAMSRWFARDRPYMLPAWTSVAAALFFAAWTLRFLPETLEMHKQNDVSDLVAVGRALSDIDGTMFVTASGALPYYSGWKAVDRLGLNSEEIAHNGLTLETIQAIHPDIVQVKSGASGKYRMGVMKHMLVNRYLLRNGFVVVAAIRLPLASYHQYYFVREDSELLDEIAARILGIDGLEYGDLRELMRIEEIEIYEPF